jgi:hypothetical protein
MLPKTWLLLCLLARAHGGAFAVLGFIRLPEEGMPRWKIGVGSIRSTPCFT